MSRPKIQAPRPTVTRTNPPVRTKRADGASSKNQPDVPGKGQVPHNPMMDMHYAMMQKRAMEEGYPQVNKNDQLQWAYDGMTKNFTPDSHHGRMQDAFEQVAARDFGPAAQTIGEEKDRKETSSAKQAEEEKEKLLARNAKTDQQKEQEEADQTEDTPQTLGEVMESLSENSESEKSAEEEQQAEKQAESKEAKATGERPPEQAEKVDSQASEVTKVAQEAASQTEAASQLQNPEVAALAEEEKEEAEAEPTEKARLQAQPPPMQMPDVTVPEDLAIDEGAAPEPMEMDKSDSSAMLHSMGPMPASSLIPAMKEAGPTANELQQKEQEDLQESMPEMEQPTGMPAKARPEKTDVNFDNREAPEAQPDTSQNFRGLNTSHEHGPNAPTDPALKNKLQQAADKDQEKDEAEEGGWFSSFFKNFSSVISTASEEAQASQNVNTSAGARPKVPLTGEADPGQSDQQKAESDAEVAQQQNEAQAASRLDFGEKDIAPDVQAELLQAEIDMAPPVPLPEADVNNAPEFDPAHQVQVDAQTKPYLDEGMNPELQKEETERAKRDADSTAERETKMAEIDAEIVSAEAEQQAVAAEARGEVDSHREDWQAENEAVMEEYHTNSATERAQLDADVNAEVDSANAEVENEFASAEAEAEAERLKAQEAARKKEQEELEKEEEGGFWSSVGNAISSVFDAIKDAVNFIFDKLKDLVTGIIELAKKAASAIIDLAAKAISGLIKAFGEVLKGLVNIVFAAFPEVAARFNALIDQAVDKACQAVNWIADKLKKAVNALLDLLGAALILILEAYQAIYLAIIEAIEFLVVGIIKIMQGIYNLVVAAGNSPGEFVGQLSEEMLGEDVTEALPNERPAVEDAAGALPQLVEQGAVQSSEEAFLSKGVYTETDFQVDPVANNEQLSPELMEQLAAMPDGAEISFGESNDEEHSIDAMRADAATSVGASSEVTGVAEQRMDAAPAAEIDRFTPGPDGLVGPFTPWERTKYLTSQMLDGIKKWFSDNKVKIILILTGAILGLILANILTGGAIMAALPLIMQVMGAIFAAEALFQAMKWFGKYLVNAFPGNVVEGGKNLARALAIGAIELIFALMFGAGAAIKNTMKAVKTVAKQGVKGAMKTGVKAAKGAAKTAIKTNVNAVKGIGAAAKSGGQALVKNGKFVVNGLKKGALKGAKKVDDLGQFLSKKFRFKKFRIRVEKFRFYLEGEINPWVLLASGDIKHVEADEVSGLRVGDEVDELIDGQRARLIGRSDEATGPLGNKLDGTDFTGNRDVRAISAEGEEAGQRLFQQFDEAERIADEARRARKKASLVSGADKRALKRLADAIGPPKPYFFNSHHIIPKHIEKFYGQVFRRFNIDLDTAFNGINLPPVHNFDEIAEVGQRRIREAGETVDPSLWRRTRHQTHPTYNRMVERRLDDIFEGFESMSRAEMDEAIEEFYELVDELRNGLESGSIPDLN